MRHAVPRRRSRPLAALLAALAPLTLAGCLHLSNDDPAIPEETPLATIPVYAHAEDFSTISGVLFKPFRDEPYWGIAFSHELSAPYGGCFALGTTELLAGRLVGDRMTLTGRPTDERFAPWQSGTFYEVFTARLTDPYAAEPDWPSGVNPGYDDGYRLGVTD